MQASETPSVTKLLKKALTFESTYIVILKEGIHIQCNILT